MKIAFIVNSIRDSHPRHTSITLGVSALARGHQVYYLNVGDCTLLNNGKLAFHTVSVEEPVESGESLLERLREQTGTVRLDVEDLDVLFLRNDPADDLVGRPWAQTSDTLFGLCAEKHDVLVLNHPDTLAHAYVDKMYFEQFPEKVKPRSIITRNLQEIERFFEAEGGKMMLKPLEGSGGADVFFVDENEKNLKQIVQSIARKGYVIAQQFLPAAKDGDIRVFMVNGRPLQVGGRYCAVRRVNEHDIRSNMHAGGRAVKAELSEETLKLVRLLGPKLLQDGIFLAGLDIVGDKLVELNITSPGGMPSASELEGVDFEAAVVEAIERKIEYREEYHGRIPNRELAVME